MTAAGPVVRLAGVAVVRDGIPILDGVDWEVRSGERWAVLGPNGSGKTTLLRVAGLRLLPTAGEVEVLGAAYGRNDVRQVRSRIAFVSGAVLRALRPTITALEVVMGGKHAALETWWQRYDETDRDRAAHLLTEFELGGATTRPFEVLSEGERQRVLLARALMASPELLLFDEPAAGLDLGARERLLETLAKLAAAPTTPPFVLVTHHVEEIPAGTTHALLMRQGSIVASGTAEAVLRSRSVSAAFDLEVSVERRDDRWSAQARSRA